MNSTVPGTCTFTNFVRCSSFTLPKVCGVCWVNRGQVQGCMVYSRLIYSLDFWITCQWWVEIHMIRVSLEASWRGFDAFFWKLDSKNLAKLNFKNPFFVKEWIKKWTFLIKVLQKSNYLLYQQTSHTQKKNSVISKFIFSIYCEICCIKNYQ